jgi:hypothetical protein
MCVGSVANGLGSIVSGVGSVVGGILSSPFDLLDGLADGLSRHGGMFFSSRSYLSPQANIYNVETEMTITVEVEVATAMDQAVITDV